VGKQKLKEVFLFFLSWIVAVFSIFFKFKLASNYIFCFEENFELIGGRLKFNSKIYFNPYLFELLGNQST